MCSNCSCSKEKKVIEHLRNKLDLIEDVLMDQEVLQGGLVQRITRNDKAKTQKIWDILYDNPQKKRGEV